ncbi:Mss4-like protein [Mariannaea sp. PMI_226]|nr:Mss4-like protein [Mariannaea sp. PMI_226]
MNPKVQCQCGAVEFYASQPEPLMVFCCHCLECQKQSASAFGTSARFPAEGMWPLPDKARANLDLWVRPTDSGNTLECYFCKTCGVRVIHRTILPDGTPKPNLSVKGGCMEDLKWDGARHIFTRTARVPVPEGSDQAEPSSDV